jgi:hypothetical protein
MRVVAATVQIRNAAKLTPHQAKVLAQWLKHQARKLIKNREEYGPRFTATLHQ